MCGWFVGMFRLIGRPRVRLPLPPARVIRPPPPPPPPLTRWLSTAADPPHIARAIAGIPRTYNSLLPYLYELNRSRKVEFGLGTIRRLQAALAADTATATATATAAGARAVQYTGDDFGTVHVTGTNGKGSVCHKIASALQVSGLRVGLYTSPHIACFRERITVNSELISESAVEELLIPILESSIRHDIPATVFELSTVLAFAHFSRSAVDFAVVEVGLGGLTDATNVLTRPHVAVLTSIGLEHTHVLGSTLDAIATQKAGIMKSRVPTVIGPTVPHVLVLNRAQELASTAGAFRLPAPVHRVAPSVEFASDFERENTAIARTALRVLAPTLDRPLVSGPALESALAVRPPARFEQFDVAAATNAAAAAAAATAQPPRRIANDVTPPPPASPHATRVVLDVCHNPSAFEKLIARLTRDYPQHDITACIGLSRDKDAVTAIQSLAGLSSVRRIHLLTASSPRAWPAHDLHDTLTAAAAVTPAAASIARVLAPPIDGGSIRSTVSDVLKQHATGGGSGGGDRPRLILCCGSFFIMREVRSALGVVEATDPVDMNEHFWKDPKHYNPPTAAKRNA